MTSLSGRNYDVSNAQTATSADNDFSCSVIKGRSNRASSLALPNYSLINLLDKEHNVLYDTLNLPPVALNGRRHSSSHYYGAHQSTQTTISNGIESHRTPSPPKKQKPLPLPLVPPPVPKRTFQGKYLKQSLARDTMSYNDATYEAASHYMQYLMSEKKYSLYEAQKSLAEYGREYSLSRSPYPLDISPGYSTKIQHHSLSTNSFDDIGDTDDLVLYDKKSYVDLNKSSSDSNRSQMTIDTGYMSANETERSSAYTTNNSAPRSFRSRFSSEDTQCSLDSFTSTDLQRTDTTDSISNMNYSSNDSPFSLKKNVFTFDRRFYERSTSKMSSLDGTQSEASESPGPISQRRLPALPARKPVLSKKGQTSTSGRNMPPMPPNRSNSNDSKILQNGQTLQGFQEQINNAKAALECTKEPPQPQEISRSHRQPSLRRLHISKPNQRQDSSLSTDSFSSVSSPGYSTKNTMEIPLLQNGSKISQTNIPFDEKYQNNEIDNLGLINARSLKKKKNTSSRVSIRQDSKISSDSFSQVSSPGYNSHLMETPLLANAAKLHTVKPTFKNLDEIEKEKENGDSNGNAITKSISTPASLQTIVRFSNGSNMSLQHKILRVRKNSNTYVNSRRLNFTLWQIIINLIALIVIAGSLIAYFKAYPTTVKVIVNKTVMAPQPIPQPSETTTIEKPMDTGTSVNPAPGVCLPVIVKFCQNYKLPYNFTIFPNYIGHFGQLEAQAALDLFDALVDVQCYELVPLFLCSLFVPKCGSTGALVPPCRSLCNETMRRCGFFFGVFGLELPDYLTCKIFTDSMDPEVCVGAKEMVESRIRAKHPQCSGFLCDQRRCIPKDWKCDGHVDCMDQTDESHCEPCGKGSIHCGDSRCMSQRHVCDGITDCPWGQDERNCVRLSERNGDMGRGTLEVYKADIKKWAPACVKNWDPKGSPTLICSLLGYRSVNASHMTMRVSNRTITPRKQDASGMWRMIQRKHSNLLKEFTSCPLKDDYPVLELTCTNYECGKIRNKFYNRPSKRIIGGKRSNPGDWPFLAAILGGPEEVFYCAGVLIADQWVLTAAHCIGNHTLRDVKDWTIQLGITRRYSHSYYGQKVSVKMAIPHPQYDAFVAHDNDIALFQLASRVAFHEHLLPVCLPPPELHELDPDTNCTVIGWGKREDKSSGSATSIGTSYEASVNEVNVPVLPRDLCNEWLEMLNVTEGMICAGYSEGGKDACQGDSGGPLLCPYPGEKDRWFVGGIVSWGIMCAHPKLPGVYANVPKYVPWIIQQIRKYSVITTETIGR